MPGWGCRCEAANVQSGAEWCRGAEGVQRGCRGGADLQVLLEAAHVAHAEREVGVGQLVLPGKGELTHIE